VEEAELPAEEAPAALEAGTLPAGEEDGAPMPQEPKSPPKSNKKINFNVLFFMIFSSFEVIFPYGAKAKYLQKDVLSSPSYAKRDVFFRNGSNNKAKRRAKPKEAFYGFMHSRENLLMDREIRRL
jgi:hypothetical protein